MKSVQKITAYKLFTLRKDGTLGSLFINRRQRIPIGKWIEAKLIPTKGFKERFGWHATAEPIAPHLSEKDRVWCQVTLQEFSKYQRPEAQGGLWYTAKYMKIERVLD